ncbi:hypothetical protein PpBr36_00882 [Pyricularia pennisetigena]|uniref:uncharacterized protein n=1 Tax=Pyricularia pennisetigena TaxID=1578925 RepID=UPI00114F2720
MSSCCCISTDTVVVECSIVTPAPQWSDISRGAIVPHIVQGLADAVLFGKRHLLHQLDGDGLNLSRPGNSRPWPRDSSVEVDVRHGLADQLGEVVLDPLGRPHQAKLLGIPRRKDDGAPRLPTALNELAKGPGHLDQKRPARDGIGGATRGPAVPVVPDDDKLVVGRAVDVSHDVPGRLQPLVHKVHHVERGAGRWPAAVADVCKGADPAAAVGLLARHAVAVERAQQLQAVAHADGDGGDLGPEIADVAAGRVQPRRVADGGRVAKGQRRPAGRATLDGRRVPGWAVGVGLVAVGLGDLAVFKGVRVEHGAHHAVLLRVLDLDAAVRPAILRQGDFAFEFDAEVYEPLVVAAGAASFWGFCATCDDPSGLRRRSELWLGSVYVIQYSAIWTSKPASCHICRVHSACDLLEPARRMPEL